MTLHIVYRELPPSSNKIYFRGTILTRKAREYAERFSFTVTREYLHLLNDIDPSKIYAISIHFYFESVLNETFNDPRVPEQKRAKTRYKKVDLSNRVKLLEDCVRDAIGVDDSHTFEMQTVKLMDRTNPRVEIFVRDVDPRDYGI